MPIYTDKRNGRLYVQFDYQRQTFMQYLPEGTTLKDARKTETKMRSDAFFEANGMKPRNEMVFDDAVQEYLAHIKHNKVKYDKAEYVLIAAKPFMKGKLVRSITAIDVERFMQYRQQAPSIHNRKRQPATIWRELAVLSAFFTFCIKKQALDHNVCRDITKPEFDNLQNVQLWPWDEEDFFAAFCDDTARDICILVLNTGLSRNDVLGLTDFNINRSVRELVFTRGKTKRHVIIPLNDRAWSVIEPRLGKGLLFPSSKTGDKLTSIRTAITNACRRVNEARRKAGLEEMPRLTIRDLRRTYGTRLDADEVTKSRLLGHKDTRMLYRYVRSTEKMREAVEKLDQTFANPLQKKLRRVK